jgi:hypothetical protein
MQRAQNPRWLLSDIGAASGRVRQSGSGRPRDLEIPFCSACRDGEERSPAGGFDADEVVSMRHVKTETPAVET